MTSSPPPLPGLTELAGRYGVQPSFVGTDGREHRAEDVVILSVLAALGAPVASGADVAAALRERRQVEGRDPLEPVLVHRVGGAACAEVTRSSGVIGIPARSSRPRSTSRVGAELLDANRTLAPASRRRATASALPAIG